MKFEFQTFLEKKMKNFDQSFALDTSMETKVHIHKRVQPLLKLVLDYVEFSFGPSWPIPFSYLKQLANSKDSNAIFRNNKCKHKGNYPFWILVDLNST